MQIIKQVADAIISRSKIMIIDENASNVLIVERMLDWAGFANVESAGDSLKAISRFKSFKPDLVILDLHMPGLSGVDLIRFIREETEPEFLPILVFSADDTIEAKAAALRAGANDFLTKPGESQEILLRVSNFLHMRQLCVGLGDKNRTLEDIVRERTFDLEKSNEEVVERLARTAEYRDDASGEHTKRIGELSALIAQALKMSDFEVGLIRLAAPLHDIGKVGVPDHILAKEGGLTPSEFAQVKMHVNIGLAILAGGETALLKMAETIIASHREHFDGTGYPNGLSGKDIPLAGRIVAVADAFDALTNNRPYRMALSRDAALAQLWKCTGTQFDPKVVEALNFLAARTVETPLQDTGVVLATGA